MRPILENRVPDEVRTPHPRHRLDRWPERLAGRAVRAVDTHGKHLFLRFEGGLTLHAHLRMTGTWAVYSEGQRWERASRRAWLALRTGDHQVVQFDGPVLALMTDARARSDRRLATLGPDILAPGFNPATALARLRADDPTRPIGDALLDQRVLAGIGNAWKVEACFAQALTRGGWPARCPTGRSSTCWRGRAKGCGAARSSVPTAGPGSSTPRPVARAHAAPPASGSVRSQTTGA